MNSFNDFILMDDLNHFLNEEKIKKPTPVQEKGIPAFLAKKNLSVLAQTGTGKTLSYLLPLFHLVKKNDNDIPMDSQIGAPRVIILTPTRELSNQVYSISKSITHHCKLRIRKLVGGDKSTYVKKVANEAFDILVTNPGRLASAFEKDEIKKDLVEILIMDEADQLLDMGFATEIQKIYQKIKRPELQMALYSATEPATYKDFLNEAFEGVSFDRIELQGVHKIKRNIETYNIQLSVKEKPNMLNVFLEKQAKGTGVIFFNRKEDVKKAYDIMKEAFPRKRLLCLHGDLTKKERQDAFNLFRDKGGVLLCSDIAARGLDIKDLKWVLNYDLPFEAVYYIHRCGRTGRNGVKGSVYNFVTSSDSILMGRINQAILNQSSLALNTLEPSKKTQKKAGKKTDSPKAKNSVKKKAVKRKNTPRYKKKASSK